MRIVSYNIRLGLDSSLDRVATVLAELQPDVVCLQEVGRYWSMGEHVDMREVLANLTGLGHAVFAPAIHEARGQYGIALLSRFPLSLVAREPLPQAADEPRVLLACAVDAPDGGYLLVTTHISVREEDRPAQFDALTRWLLTWRGRQEQPSLVVGDLNAELDEAALKQAMRWCHLRSAHRVAAGASPATFPTGEPELAIDHILLSHHWTVDAAGAAAVEGSDHLPIWADIHL